MDVDELEKSAIRLTRIEEKKLKELLEELIKNINEVIGSIKAHSPGWKGPPSTKISLFEVFKKLQGTLRKIQKINALKKVSSDLIYRLDTIVSAIKENRFTSVNQCGAQFNYFLDHVKELIALINKMESFLEKIEALERIIYTGRFK